MRMENENDKENVFQIQTWRFDLIAWTIAPVYTTR